MLGSGKGVSGMVGISQNEVGAGTFPDNVGSCCPHTLNPERDWVLICAEKEEG